MVYSVYSLSITGTIGEQTKKGSDDIEKERNDIMENKDHVITQTTINLIELK